VHGAVRREAAAIAFFALLSVLATRPLAVHLADQTLIGPDPAIYVWTVNWVSGHLLSPGRLFEGNIYHPTPHSALLSDFAFGTSLLVAPLRPWIGDPLVLYNVGVLLTLTFGAWGFWCVTRWLTRSASAGLLAGTLAAFGPHQLRHVYQLALVNIGWLALMLLALELTFREPRRLLPAALLGVAFALNALSSGYFAVAGAMLALVYAVVHWRALRARPVWIACAAAAALALLLLTPYMRAFGALQKAEGIERPLVVNIDQAFHPGQDLGSGAYAYAWLLGGEGEQLFPGLTCLVLAFVACRRRVPGWAFYLAGVLVLLLVSLGPELQVAGHAVPLPYAWLFARRPFNAMMHPYSFAAVSRLCLCVLAGLGWSSLSWTRRRWGLAAAIALGLAEVAGPGLALRPIAPGVPAVYAALEGLPPGAVLELPPESPDALIWAARHGRPVLNGAGAMSPRDHSLLEKWIARDWLRPVREGRPLQLDESRAMAQLLSMPVRYVVVPAGHRRGLRPVQEAFDRSRSFRRVAGTPGEDTLYERAGGGPSSSGGL